MINLPPFPKPDVPDWHGLTLREIQMRRIMVQTRMEIEKCRMSAGIDHARQHMPLIGGNGSSVFSRIASAFTFAEYAFMAIRVIRWIVALRKKH